MYLDRQTDKPEQNTGDPEQTLHDTVSVHGQLCLPVQHFFFAEKHGNVKTCMVRSYGVRIFKVYKLMKCKFNAQNAR